MKCPFCGYEESKVVDSRHSEDGSSIRRRRECLSCGKRFTTYETVESLPLVVIKKDNSRQSFDRNKILNGMSILQPYIDSGKLVVKSGQIEYTATAIQSWDSSKAQARMDNLLSGFYANKHLDAVLVAADCLALGVISSLESMRIPPVFSY